MKHLRLVSDNAHASDLTAVLDDLCTRWAAFDRAEIMHAPFAEVVRRRNEMASAVAAVRIMRQLMRERI